MTSLDSSTIIREPAHNAKQGHVQERRQKGQPGPKNDDLYKLKVPPECRSSTSSGPKSASAATYQCKWTGCTGLMVSLHSLQTHVMETHAVSVLEHQQQQLLPVQKSALIPESATLTLQQPLSASRRTSLLHPKDLEDLPAITVTPITNNETTQSADDTHAMKKLGRLFRKSFSVDRRNPEVPSTGSPSTNATPKSKSAPSSPIQAPSSFHTPFPFSSISATSVEDCGVLECLWSQCHHRVKYEAFSAHIQAHILSCYSRYHKRRGSLSLSPSETLFAITHKIATWARM
jgi:hypothetical protein